MNIDQNAILNSASIEANSMEEIENDLKSLELIEAIQENDIVTVTEMLSEGEVLVNHLYKKEISALGAAAHEGNIAIMDILFRNRAVINQSFSGGMDAGWLAMENHKYEAFDWLVSKGLNLNNRLIETSETRLISAVKNSDLRMVSRLLQLRVNPQDSDIEGRTALHYNLAKNPFEIDDLKIGELLLAENCDPNRQDKHGLSSHAYIKDDQAFTLLNSYELDKVNKVALKRMEAREEAIKAKNEKKATPEKVANKKQNKKSNAKAKPKKYYPK